MVLKKLHILPKVLFGIFLFYLMAGFILIPLILGWVIPDQGTKFLKHPVHLQSVGFNPFLYKLTLNGFEIQDDQHQKMIGFDRLLIDISIRDIFRKIYHVKLIELDRLQINAELLAGNRINLLGLIPANTDSKAKVQSTVSTSNPLPTVIIDSIQLHDSQVHFVDKTIKPNFVATMGSMALVVTNVTTLPDSQAKVKFQANLDDQGKVSMDAIIKPWEKPLAMETTVSLNDYALKVLTPYTGKYAGRELRNGKLDFKMEYTISDNKLVASHQILIQRFEFGNSVKSPDALHLPFGLAVALLEDPQGKITIALPVTGNMSDPKFQYSHLITQVIRNFFINLVTKPFSFLASSLGVANQGSDELGYVRFPPGMAVLTVSQQKRLLALIKSLQGHPKLHLEIDGSYDLDLDWKAIQADSFTKDYEQLRNGSTRPESKIYQLLYQRRFGIRALWSLAKKYKKGIGDYNDVKLDANIKQQLIEDAPPDLAHLGVLAESRAKLIYEFLVVNGLEAKKMTIGTPQATRASLGYVPLAFTLTVFDK